MHTFVVQLLSPVRLFVTPMVCSTPGFPVLHYLSEFVQIHIHRIGDAIQPSHLLSSPFILPSIFPSIRVFSNESALRIRWPKHWSFSFSISPSDEYSGLISFRIDWFDLLVFQGLSRVFSSTTVRKHQWKLMALKLIFLQHRPSSEPKLCPDDLPTLGDAGDVVVKQGTLRLHLSKPLYHQQKTSLLQTSVASSVATWWEWRGCEH